MTEHFRHPKWRLPERAAGYVTSRLGPEHLVSRSVNRLVWWIRKDTTLATALFLLAIPVCLAAGADLCARFVTGYAYDEVRPENALAPAGCPGVPLRYREFDGDSKFFPVFESGYPEELPQALNCLESGWTTRVGKPGVLVAAAWKRMVADCVVSPDIKSSLAPADSDGDGWVDRGEMVRTVAVLHMRAEDLAAMDGDRDGRVSREEFLGAPETATHWLGTDRLGRDVLTRLLYGLRVSLLVALLATAVAFCLGAALGLSCGYVGGAADAVMLRLLEVLQAVPFLFVVILLSVTVRDVFRMRWSDAQTQALAQSILLFCALGAVQWFSLARFARGLAVSLRTSDFTKALVGMGFSNRQVVLKHLLPNALTPLLSYSVLLVPVLIMEEAFLSFLGFGIQPPYPSLGNLLNDGVATMESVPALLIAPALAVLAVTATINVVGERLSSRFSGTGRDS